MGIFDIKPWRKKNEEQEGLAETPVLVEEKAIEDRIIDQIRLVFDPEIPVNIYELGLIYHVLVEEDKAIVQMTLTSPQCPAAQEIPVDVKGRVEELAEIVEAQVDIIWEPPWEPSMMSEMAKMELGMF